MGEGGGRGEGRGGERGGEGALFSLLLYCESGIYEYDGQKTLTDVFVASLLLLELGFFRNIVFPYHLRLLLHEKIASS